MEDTIAELRRQLEEERKAREEAERRAERDREAREEAERRAERDREAREEAERRAERERKAREEAERPSQPNTLWGLLHRCHESLSHAFRVETDEKLLTRGPTTEPVNRLYPKRIARWVDFPQLQEQVWTKFDSADAFTSRPLFSSDTAISQVALDIKAESIYSELSLRNFERVAVENFVKSVIQALRSDELLRHEFGIHGRITLYDRPSLSEPSLDKSLEQRDLQGAQTPQRLANASQSGTGRWQKAAQTQKSDSTSRRRNRRADQICVHITDDARQTPVYAVEYKAPHKLTIPELVTGLHPLDLARDVIGQEGVTFEFYATRLVAAVVTQIFSYMIDSGVRYGYICTGEAFVFLRIPQDDPTVVQYSLCIPNQDVQGDDELRLHRTAIGQVLAFTLQALAADAPSQKWRSKASKLTTWEVEYSDVLKKIPETLRKDPPASNYRPSHWKRTTKIHNTRSRARCQPHVSPTKHLSTEGSDSEEGLHSPSTAAASRRRLSRGRGNNRHSKGRGRRPRNDRNRKQTSRKNGQDAQDEQSILPFCTIACIRGIVNRGPLDKKCPNWKLHGSHTHSIGPQEFTRQLDRQFSRNPYIGFEPLHIRGRTGYILKATLLSHGYTVIIKATTIEKQHHLQAEADNYHHLRSLQGQQIPVFLGMFTPRVSYYYHGDPMEQMMILSWSGKRLQFVINDENSRFFHEEREKALAILRSHGAVHGDIEWRNMLWDDLSGRLIVIDLEDMKWLKRPRDLGPTKPGKAGRGHRATAGKPGQGYSSRSAAAVWP
ncbi:hypothetical protein POX_d04880 [Penicillium oxalicum]|uniref:hypothetical protein n=1 Tax=Penicillium oxalicum TaxID=69781 RepID=UPI0020B6D263|nr:hypothetical protein POX_d04880 [Penicillium oxalicum]KAI2789392.1 hypothetical protein POX_d04880 [Penicillium oxalicum]